MKYEHVLSDFIINVEEISKVLQINFKMEEGRKGGNVIAIDISVETINMVLPTWHY